MPNLSTFSVLGRPALSHSIPVGPSPLHEQWHCLSASYSKSRHRGLPGSQLWRPPPLHPPLLSLRGNTAHVLSPYCCPPLGWGRASESEWELRLCGSCWDRGPEGTAACFGWLGLFLHTQPQLAQSPPTWTGNENMCILSVHITSAPSYTAEQEPSNT
jgi:hypothetical protein